MSKPPDDLESKEQQPGESRTEKLGSRIRNILRPKATSDRIIVKAFGTSHFTRAADESERINQVIIPGRSRASLGMGEVSASPIKETAVATSPKWRAHLDSYPYRDLRAVTFTSEGDLARALDRCFDPDHPLYGIPRDIVNSRTLILPQAALEYLNDLSFTPYEVISAGDLTAPERAQLVKAQGRH